MHGSDIPLTQQLAEFAANFVSLHSNRKSLITVTNTDLSLKANTVTFFVSVYPKEAEGPAIGFLMRKRGDCKEYIKQHLRTQRIPHVEFKLDEGEKNRQRVDELLGE